MTPLGGTLSRLDIPARRRSLALSLSPMETITSEQPTVPAEAVKPEDPEPVVPRRSPLRAAIKTGRPKEWIKNVFVFAGLLFSGKFNQPHDVLEAFLTFVAFCLISSAGYFVNDLIDVELDRKHPTKRFRPLAARELSESVAKTIAPVLALVAIALAFAAVNWQVGLMVVGYGIAQMAYSFGLKQIVIIDVMTLAGLFILRVAAGASAVEAHASEWLILCTGMLAAFLGFTKRRQEAVSELHEGTSTRPVLEHYSLPFLDQMVSMVTTGTVISYAIYTVNSPLIGSQMMLTIPPVVYGIFRYLYLIYDRSDDRSMAAIVAGDRGIQAAGASYALIAFLLLYVFN
jgi:4-hydroxybenzoate polyprenyltransferase